MKFYVLSGMGGGLIARIPIGMSMIAKRISLILIAVGYCLFTCYAQQRSVQSVDSIVDEYSRVHGCMNLQYAKTKSSSIINDEYLLSGKEAFYIYTSTSLNKSSFLIVSGDAKQPSILAYSDSCAFDVDNMPPAVRYWLQTYVAQLKNGQTFSSEKSSPSSIEYKEEGVAPLLQGVKWGQTNPFNKLCPIVRNERTVTGCVATAMAQVMRYYSYPTEGKGSVDYNTTTNHLRITHDFSKDVFDWGNMADSYSGTYSDVQSDAVAVLMASCGASVKMDYCTSAQGGSGAYQSDILSGYIANYGYDSDAALAIRNYCSTDVWHKLLVGELNAGRPVNYAGSNMRDGGHSFVIDGYRIGNNKYPDYHVNWGWNGSCDGYYQIADLQPKEGNDYATAAPFSESQQITVGVMPEDGVTSNSQVLLSSKVSCSLSAVRPGSTLTFNASSLYNCSYKEFIGRISAALIGDDGVLHALSEGSKRQLDYLEGTGILNIECTIPSSIETGKYQSCLVYKTSGSEGWKEVYSSSTPVVEVTVDREDGTTSEEWTEIGCADLELLKGDEQDRILANVYEVRNLQTEPFEGCLFFTVADEGGCPLFSFGESSYVSELGYMDYLDTPVRINGTIDVDIPDGQYRLYISAQRSHQQTLSYVVKNDMKIPEAPTTELYCRVIVSNGRAYIDNKEYGISPTNIDGVQSSQDSEPLYYTLDGRRVYRSDSLSRGIYIMLHNGMKKMVRL